MGDSEPEGLDSLSATPLRRNIPKREFVKPKWNLAWRRLVLSSDGFLNPTLE